MNLGTEAGFPHEITHFHFFAGLGGMALGFQHAHARVGRLTARPRCLGGIDVNADAIQDFTKLVGVQGTVLDLFDEPQYRAFHGAPPPAGWREVTPGDILAAAGGEHPDIVALSPPCKGFSGLLNPKSAQSAKYQALNQLTLRSVALMMDAFRDDPPALVLLENVPRIQTRGRGFLDEITTILRCNGYAVAETVHDCGEIGGLAQHRQRFLLIARHLRKVPPFLYEPPPLGVKTVGEVLGEMPSPSSSLAMHHCPRLTWRTWVRLALIPAGKDWRALQGLDVVDGHLTEYGLADATDWHAGVLGICPWDRASGTLTGGGVPTRGTFSVADPRCPDWRSERTGRVSAYGQYGVRPWNQASGTVTSQAAPGAGPFSIADPRLGCDVTNRRQRRFNNVYRVIHYDEPAGSITGGAGPSSGGQAIGDPRVFRNGKNSFVSGGHYGVVPWDGHAPTITGRASYDNGRFSVADHRVVMAPHDRPADTPLIVSLDGTWHRPFTSLECMALQGFPWLTIATGGGLEGKADSRHRERAGNAVPPPSAQAMASQMFDVLLRAEAGESFSLSALPIWVQGVAAVMSADLGVA